MEDAEALNKEAQERDWEQDADRSAHEGQF